MEPGALGQGELGLKLSDSEESLPVSHSGRAHSSTGRIEQLRRSGAERRAQCSAPEDRTAHISPLLVCVCFQIACLDPVRGDPVPTTLSVSRSRASAKIASTETSSRSRSRSRSPPQPHTRGFIEHACVDWHITLATHSLTPHTHRSAHHSSSSC